MLGPSGFKVKHYSEDQQQQFIDKQKKDILRGNPSDGPIGALPHDNYNTHMQQASAQFS